MSQPQDWLGHVLEHMMFKGTKTLAAGEFSRRVAALGGRENAFTSREYTGYFQQVHRDALFDVMAWRPIACRTCSSPTRSSPRRSWW